MLHSIIVHFKIKWGKKLGTRIICFWLNMLFRYLANINNQTVTDLLRYLTNALNTIHLGD